MAAAISELVGNLWVAGVLGFAAWGVTPPDDRRSL